MAKPTVSLPQGTRDFEPIVWRKRQFIIETIRQVFACYGFEPLETPAMENLDTLMGKYGEEGDKLIFKILNNGLDRPEKHEKARTDFEKVLEGKNVPGLTERALRYDLTIPFARYVAMNHTKLHFPFKRYQIQPVWRADRPQKGRYREFYQCDADIVGSRSALNETELVFIYATVFKKLGIDVEIRINNRKILAALAEICGGADKLTDITVAIDKLDKIGLEKVKEELSTRGLSLSQITLIEQYLTIGGDSKTKMEQLTELIGGTEIGKEGLSEIGTLLQSLSNQTFKDSIITDFTLARGLNYYTGMIFEVKATRVKMGSIGGGGRYNDLTGLFGVPDLPGIGISFGLDRIYDVMEESSLFPASVHSGTRLLFMNLGEAESQKAFELMQVLREKNIACELFHEMAKLDKQFKYAEKKQIGHVAIIGSKELEAGLCQVKNLQTGEQKGLTYEELLEMDF